MHVSLGSPPSTVPLYRTFREVGERGSDKEGEMARGKGGREREGGFMLLSQNNDPIITSFSFNVNNSS